MCGTWDLFDIMKFIGFFVLIINSLYRLNNNACNDMSIGEVCKNYTLERLTF